MTTVVKNDENADQESSRWDGKCQGQPIGNAQRPVHRQHDGKVWQRRIGHLPKAAPEIRILEFRRRAVEGRVMARSRWVQRAYTSGFSDASGMELELQAREARRMVGFSHP